MAQVNTSDVFPSLVSLTTDATGELGEVVGSPATTASLDLYGDGDITITANQSGASGSDLSVSVVDNQGGTDQVQIFGNEIRVMFRDSIVAASGGTAAFYEYNSAFTITSNTVGANSVIDFSVIDNVAGLTQNEVKINASDGDIAVCLFDDLATGNGGGGYTNQDIYDLLTDNLTSWYASLNSLVTVGSIDPVEATNAAINVSDTLSGGVDPTGQYPSNGSLAIVNLINADEEASALVTATGGSSTLPSTIVAQSLTGGVDAIPSTLDFNSEYLCLKVSEIHSLLNSEIGDARKIIWGMIETYSQHVLGLAVQDQPENFIASRGNPTLVIDQAGTRIRQNYTFQAFYEVSNLDLEAETGA
jgi:hypothetical protein